MAYQPFNVIRRDSDLTLGADNDVQALYNNSVGRLKVSQWPGAFDATVGTITANAQTVVAEVSRAGSATIGLSGTYSTINVTFEATVDGTNWALISVKATNGTTAITATGNQTNATLLYDISPILGVTQIRVRATAFTSGTMNVRIVPAANAVEISPVVSGAVTVSGSLTSAGTVSTVTTLTSVTNGVKAAVNTTAGGATTFTLVSAATTNSTLVGTAAARSLYGVQAFNNGASVCYVKIYANATAPTVGTTVPVMTFAVPPAGGFIFTAPPQGCAIAAGLGVAITGGNTTADTTAVAAAQVNLNVQYA